MKEGQYLIRYFDFTLDTGELTPVDAAYLRHNPAVDDVRRLNGYSRFGLDEALLKECTCQM